MANPAAPGGGLVGLGLYCCGHQLPGSRADPGAAAAPGAHAGQPCLSAALPTAFGAGGLVVAGAFVTMQLGRTIFAIVALRSRWCNARSCACWPGTS